MLQKVYYNFLIAVEAIANNKLRSLLTSLGIIFGVASVIAMLAIGKGAEQEILQQIKLLGANNIIVRPVVEQEQGPVEEAQEESESAQSEKRSFSPGLTMADAQSIKAVIPQVQSVSPEVVVETEAIRAGLRRTSKLVGVSQRYFDHPDITVADGNLFTQHQLASAAPVAIIGSKVKTRFFAREEAVGNRIKCGNLWLTVVGVLDERSAMTQELEDLGIRNYNYDIYTPINTMLLRYENRARVTPQDVERAQQQNGNEEPSAAQTNYHQLDQIIVRVADSEMMHPVSEVISRMLKRRHNGVVDYHVIIPEQLLAQERRTQTIFNIVLASIASISLIVGGIGIMNIMLASVLERIREIGIRRSVGATRQDVIQQFLIEAVTISFTGGILGILLGILISAGIERMANIATIVSIESVLISFLVSAGVGLIFGLLPAKRAAEHDPVLALRHE